MDEFDRPFQSEIGFFKFVIELEISLGKFDRFHVQFLEKGCAQDVEPSEHPASSGFLLVGDVPRGDLHGENVLELGGFVLVDAG